MTTTIYGLSGENLAEEPKPRTGRLVPEAGRVIVVRSKPDPYERLASGDVARGLDGRPIEKHPDTLEWEEGQNVNAMILSVGEPDPQNGYAGTWRERQRVIIQPHVFVKVPGTDKDGLSLWLGSFYGITARWEEVAEDG